ncbi:MAG: 30S ribosomal protein S8 [Candidatus Portnoybacteria bacterium]|nr:30S ribosomal protein S8 [Candidatus Portnoybacteria bacterium]
MVDPISDMLIRIKNAQAVSHQTVNVPFSKIKFNLAKVLEKEGLIEAITTQGRKIKKIIEIKLKYEKAQPAIKEIKRISKPGQRIYLKKSQVKPIRQGYGLAIISTSQGLMTNKEAKKKGLGGEILCEIW